MKLSVFCIVLTLPTIGYAIEPLPAISVDKAIEVAAKPALAPQGRKMSPSSLQVTYRITSILREHNYQYQKEDATAWKKCLLDEKQNIYSRMCAAYFLLDHEPAAQQFITTQIESKDLRHRYNAAETLVMQLRSGSLKKPWGAELLFKSLADGLLDGNDIRQPLSDDFPDGDADDILNTPIEGACLMCMHIKHKQTVPTLVGVLERRPQTHGAVDALAEVGDERAIPVLIKALKDRSEIDSERIIAAFGRLRAKEAVPELISRLTQVREETIDHIESLETKGICDALAEIGDKQAVPALEAFMKGNAQERPKAAASRALVQLSSSDPIKELLGLLDRQTFEPERVDIIDSLIKHPDERVIDRLTALATSSDSAFMRREAILALSDIGDRKSLLVLASLLDKPFPANLKAELGFPTGADKPNFTEYFPEMISLCLFKRTKQTFGTDRAKWEAWIEKNTPASAPKDAEKPGR